MPSGDGARRCQQCGALLPTDAPALTLCPFCLYRLGLDAASKEMDGLAADSQLQTETVDVSLPPSHPDRIGPYRILQPLKEGGMGIVYLAEQQEPIRRRVALKLIKPGMDSREVVARFESERQALALMDHPSIARVFDAGTAPDGRPYFVMEYVPGLRITTYCDEHRMSNQDRVRLFAQVCAAVQHAHQKGIIHRDLKPSNVLVMQQDGRPVPKIIDFGIAKALNQPLTQRTIFTQLGRIVGTIEYMSPEQAEGSLDVDATSDIYSLGVLLYELMVGALPFDSKMLREVGYAEMQRVIREHEPARPSTRLSGLGDTAREVARLRQTDLTSLERELRGDLDWITMKAMEKNRIRRYASASELASDLNRHLNDEPVVARPPSALYRISKFVRKHTGAVAAGIAIVSALSIALVLSTVSYSRAEVARRALQKESYVANVRAADLHLRSGEVSEARRRLASADPDLRGWEWRHLFLKSDASVGMLASGGAPIALGVSSDSKRVFWVSAFGVLRMADAGTREQLPQLTRPNTDGSADKPPEYVIGVSADGTRYASVAWAVYGTRGRREGDATITESLHGAVPPEDENTILIKKTETGETLARLSAPIGGERRVTRPPNPTPTPRERGSALLLPATAVFSRDGRYAATWSAEPVIRIHDAANGLTVAELSGHQNVIAAGEFSPDAGSFLSGSYDGTIRLWNLKTHTAEKVITHEGSVWAVAFSPDGRQIASGGADQLIKLWDLNGSPIATFRGHTGGIQALAFAPDGGRLASASADRSIRVWNTASGSSVVVLVGHTQTVTSLAFTPDGRQLVSGSIDNTIRIWDLDRAAVSIARPLGPKAPTFTRYLVALSQDGRRVAAESSDGFVRVWDRGLPGETTFKGHGPYMRALAFTADGTRLVSVSSKDVWVWDSRTGQLISTRVWPEPLYRMSLLPDGRRLIELTQNGGVRLWTVEGSDAPLSLSPGFDRPSDGYLEMVASSNNQRIAIGNSGQLGVWDLARRTRLQLIDLDALNVRYQMGVVALSPDGTQVASGNEDGTLRLWDVASGRLLYQYSAHDGPVRSLAFNPIGLRLVSASMFTDRNVRIWLAQPPPAEMVGVQGPLRIGEPLLTLEHESAVEGFKISADGTTMATWDRGGLRLWDSESAYAVEPRLTADVLRSSGLTSVEAIAALKTDSSLTPAAQRDVMKYLSAHSDHPQTLYIRAWQIATIPGLPAEAYSRALALAESATQIAPWLPGGSVSTTLGAVYYRMGRYTEALACFQAAMRLRPEDDPDLTTLAFTAMANQRLGRTEAAREALERFQALLKKGVRGVSREAPALGREAASVVGGANLAPK